MGVVAVTSGVRATGGSFSGSLNNGSNFGSVAWGDRMKGRSSGGLDAVASESLTAGPATSIFGSSIAGSSGGNEGSLNGSGSFGFRAAVAGREVVGRDCDVSSGAVSAGKLGTVDDRDAWVSSGSTGCGELVFVWGRRVFRGLGDGVGDDTSLAGGVKSGLSVAVEAVAAAAAAAEGLSAVAAGVFPAKCKLPAGTAGVLGCGCGRVRGTVAGGAAAVLVGFAIVVAGLAATAFVGLVSAEVTGAGFFGAGAFGAGVKEAVPRAAREAETGGFAAFRELVDWGLAGGAGFFDWGGSTAGSSVKPPELRPAFADADVDVDLGSAPGAADGAVVAVDCSDAAPLLVPAPKNMTEASSGLVSSLAGTGLLTVFRAEGLPALLLVFFPSSSEVKLTGVTVVAASGNSNWNSVWDSVGAMPLDSSSVSSASASSDGSVSAKGLSLSLVAVMPSGSGGTSVLFSARATACLSRSLETVRPSAGIRLKATYAMPEPRLITPTRTKILPIINRMGIPPLAPETSLHLRIDGESAPAQAA